VTQLLAPEPSQPVPAGTAAPTISVVIAAYQAAAFIADAVDSVLGQTHPAHELVVCDDGSTDDLAGALERYGDAVTLVRQENQGAAAARNRAVAETTGEFVAILDADDVFLPEYIERIAAAAAARPDLDIISCNAYLEIDGRTTGTYYPDVATFVVDDQRRGALHNHFIFGLATIRRERLLAVGGWDESTPPIEDTDCFIRLILDGARAGLVEEPLARYRLREGSQTSDRATTMAAQVTMLEKFLDHPALDDGDRDFLRHELRIKRAEARVAVAEAALARGTPNRRSAALALAFGELPPGTGLGTRLRALAAAIAPSLARARLTRRPGGRSALRRETRGR
jgi:glycosyltransferase involved in cell wall biosynthesis